MEVSRTAQGLPPIATSTARFTPQVHRRLDVVSTCALRTHGARGEPETRPARNVLAAGDSVSLTPALKNLFTSNAQVHRSLLVIWDSPSRATTTQRNRTALLQDCLILFVSTPPQPSWIWYTARAWLHSDLWRAPLHSLEHLNGIFYLMPSDLTLSCSPALGSAPLRPPLLQPFCALPPLVGYAQVHMETCKCQRPGRSGYNQLHGTCWPAVLLLPKRLGDHRCVAELGCTFA